MAKPETAYTKTTKVETAVGAVSKVETAKSDIVKPETASAKNPNYDPTLYNENQIYNKSEAYNGSGYGVTRETAKAEVAFTYAVRAETRYV